MCTQDTIRQLADRFDVTKSSIIRVRRRMAAKVLSLQDLLIRLRSEGSYSCTKMIYFYRWPSERRQRSIRANFRMQKGLDGVVGLIDGCHIHISSPDTEPENFINRKGFHSIILQGVCDDRKVFTDVYVGWPGSVHDARVFRRSPLAENLECGKFCKNNSTFLLGDAAYPLRQYLIVPFKDNGHLTAAEKRYE